MVQFEHARELIEAKLEAALAERDSLHAKVIHLEQPAVKVEVKTTGRCRHKDLCLCEREEIKVYFQFIILSVAFWTEIEQ